MTMMDSCMVSNRFGYIVAIRFGFIVAIRFGCIVTINFACMVTIKLISLSRDRVFLAFFFLPIYIVIIYQTMWN